MAIRIDHALAADTSLAQPSRKLFATTIIAYADRLGLLAERVRDVAARGGARDADAVATPSSMERAACSSCARR
jgi:hypothetical protein